MNWYPILFLALACWIIGFGASFLLAGLQYPLVRMVVARRPASRYTSGFWFTWALLPLLGGSALAVIAGASGWLSAQGWITDHCLEHPGHIHLCLKHIGAYPVGWAFWGVAFVLWLLLAVSTIRLFRSMQSFRSGLLSLPISRQEPDVVWLDCDVPLAFAAGVVRPRCYLSEGLKSVLDETQVGIVRSHEEAHLRRYDPLRLLLLRWLEHWLPGVRFLSEKWREASEIECDGACLDSGFSRSQVASTILLMQRRSGETAGLLGLAYGPASAHALRHRVEALVLGDKRRRAAPIWVLITVCCLLAGTAFVEIHHALETILGWLA